MGGLSNSRGNSRKSAPVKNSHGNSQESAPAKNIRGNSKSAAFTRHTRATIWMILPLYFHFDLRGMPSYLYGSFKLCHPGRSPRRAVDLYPG